MRADGRSVVVIEILTSISSNTLKARSTLELSPECPEISVKQDLASATQREALHPC